MHDHIRTSLRNCLQTGNRQPQPPTKEKLETSMDTQTKTKILVIKSHEVTINADQSESLLGTWRPAPRKSGQMQFERTVVTTTDAGEVQHRQKLHRVAFGKENIPEG